MTRNEAVVDLGDFACAVTRHLAIIEPLFRTMPAMQASFKASEG
jgi:hypothetical protein